MSVTSRTERMRTGHREIMRDADQIEALRMPTDHFAILEMFDRPLEPIALFHRRCRREEVAIYQRMNRIFEPTEQRELLLPLQKFEI